MPRFRSLFSRMSLSQNRCTLLRDKLWRKRRKTTSGVLLVEDGVGFGFGRLRAALGDTDHGRAQHALADGEACLHDLDDRVVRHLRVRHLEHRLMEIRIELLADRLELAHTMAFERRQHGAFGHLHTLDQRGQAGIGRGLGLRRDGIQRPAQIVGDGEHVAGETRDGIGLGVLDLALGAAAQIVHLGGKAQVAVAQLAVFGFQKLKRVWLGGLFLHGIVLDVGGSVGCGIGRSCVRSVFRRFIGHDGLRLVSSDAPDIEV
ncbi:hypothetical protein RHECNPAF_850056 [Rhizobium etli CNPAF512]|nr:hypothetical protein RHECNPAF_850056 [Rhizobium etli CNPAF512]